MITYVYIKIWEEAERNISKKIKLFGDKTYQNPDSVCTQNADNNGHDGSKDQSGIVEGIGHSEDSGSKRTLQKMKKCAERSNW